MTPKTGNYPEGENELNRADEKIIEMVVRVPADTDVCVIDMGRGYVPQTLEIKGVQNVVRLRASGQPAEKPGDPGA